MALRQADRLESNNPKAYGVVKATEISGHKTVRNLTELYSISDCILSDSKTNENNDAIGQEWYVVDQESYYRLINWAERGGVSGWRKIEQIDSVQELVSQVNTNKEDIKTINGSGEGSISKAISDLKSEILGTATEDYNTLGKIETIVSNISTNALIKINQGDGINISEKVNGEQTISAISEIDDTATGEVINKTYSANKINSLIKVKDIADGLGTTVTEEAGVVKVNVSIDNQTLKLSSDGKLGVGIIDGGTY